MNAVIARNDNVDTEFHRPASQCVRHHLRTSNASADAVFPNHFPLAGPPLLFPNLSATTPWTFCVPTQQFSDPTEPSFYTVIESERFSRAAEQNQWPCAESQQFLRQSATEVAPCCEVIPASPSKQPKSCWFYPVDEPDEWTQL
jgi:hypothetical protein